MHESHSSRYFGVSHVRFTKWSYNQDTVINDVMNKHDEFRLF